MDDGNSVTTQSKSCVEVWAREADDTVATATGTEAEHQASACEKKTLAGDGENATLHCGQDDKKAKDTTLRCKKEDEKGEDAESSVTESETEACLSASQGRDANGDNATTQCRQEAVTTQCQQSDDEDLSREAGGTELEKGPVSDHNSLDEMEVIKDNNCKPFHKEEDEEILSEGGV